MDGGGENDGSGDDNGGSDGNGSNGDGGGGDGFVGAIIKLYQISREQSGSLKHSLHPNLHPQLAGDANSMFPQNKFLLGCQFFVHV